MAGVKTKMTRLNILFGGKAGQGPNVLTRILAKTLSEVVVVTVCEFALEYDILDVVKNGDR